MRWDTPEEKKKTLKPLSSSKRNGLGFLLNESRFIEKEGQRLAIVGVENWGSGFKQAGDLE